MLITALIATVAGVTTMAFSILPDGIGANAFLPLPAGVGTALQTVSGWAGWVLGLFGTEIKGAMVISMKMYLAMLVPLFLWEVMRRFSFPIVGRWINQR